MLKEWDKPRGCNILLKSEKMNWGDIVINSFPGCSSFFSGIHVSPDAIGPKKGFQFSARAGPNCM